MPINDFGDLNRKGVSIKPIVLFLILGWFLTAPGFAQDYAAEAEVSIPLGKKEKPLTVTYVVQGDLMNLSNGEKLRLIGIEAPEAGRSAKAIRNALGNRGTIADEVALGRRAREFTADLVEKKKVRLEFDARKRDAYGKLLAYLYLEDGTFVNAKIAEEGYAKAMPAGPNLRYQEMFQKLEDEARKNKRGLWTSRF